MLTVKVGGLAGVDGKIVKLTGGVGILFGHGRPGARVRVTRFTWRKSFALTAFAIDGQFKGDGWNAGAGVGFISLDEADQDLFLLYAQGGYFFTPQIEGFARYDFLDLDDDSLAEDALSYFTIGANYFFVEGSYAARFIGEIVFALEEQAVSIPEVGVLATGEDNQIAIKGQLNLSF